MSFIFTNVTQTAYIADPSTSVVRGFITKIDKLTVDFDGSSDLVHGGSGFLPFLTIGKDRNPTAEIDGLEFPFHLLDYIVGTTSTKASTGTPLQVRTSEQRTIGADGKLNAPLSNPISASNTTVSVITDLDYQKFTPIASAATQGQFVTPAAGDTNLTFNTADANKTVNIAYVYDITSGGKIGQSATSMPKTNQFVASGTCVNTSDPNRTAFQASLFIPICQFVGKLQAAPERNKVSSNKIPLTILDPGGGQNALEITIPQTFM